MRNKAGILCMVLGTVLILSALALFHYNRREAFLAEKASMNLLPQLMQEIQEGNEKRDEAVETEDPNLEEAFAMKEVMIDEYAYIGYLTIPTLNLELPIMAEWDSARLRIAPCRYAGTLKAGNLVLMAHNYAKHFGQLSGLTEGDGVLFTDVDGVVTQYTVVGFDILDPYAVEEMTAGEFDLTLFTCTYGGQNRVTVYCDRVS